MNFNCFFFHLFCNGVEIFCSHVSLIHLSKATFDIIDFSFISSEYSIKFVNGSNALGALIIFLLQNNSVTDFSKSVYFVQSKPEAENINLVRELSAGNYTVLAYDIEESGRITSDMAAETKDVTVTESSAQASEGKCKVYFNVLQ